MECVDVEYERQRGAASLVVYVVLCVDASSGVHTHARHASATDTVITSVNVCAFERCGV